MRHPFSRSVARRPRDYSEPAEWELCPYCRAGVPHSGCQHDSQVSRGARRIAARNTERRIMRELVLHGGAL